MSRTVWPYLTKCSGGQVRRGPDDCHRNNTQYAVSAIKLAKIPYLGSNLLHLQAISDKRSCVILLGKPSDYFPILHRVTKLKRSNQPESVLVKPVYVLLQVNSSTMVGLWVCRWRTRDPQNVANRSDYSLTRKTPAFDLKHSPFAGSQEPR